MKIRNVKMIEVYDWDTLVEKTYGKPYSFQQQEGCKSRGTFELTIPDSAQDFKNKSVPDIINGDKMGVSFKAWLKRDIKEWNGDDGDAFMVDLFWQRNWYPDVQMVANDLHKRGLIEAGEYVINIDW